MLKIWGRPNSINVQKVLWVADELGLDYVHEPAGMAYGKVGEEWYREMNPNGLVPTIDDDGAVFWESNVIVRYLASKHDAGGLIPDDAAGRASAEMWMDWQQTVVHPGITPVFWNLIRTAEADRDLGAVAQGAAKVQGAMRVLERRLSEREYLLGDRLTVADIPLGCATYRWLRLDVDHGHIPNVRAWYQRLAARKPFQEHVMLPLT